MVCAGTMTAPADWARPLRRLPWRVAAPSFVRPGTVAENCRLLDGQVDEVGVCLFEGRTCLAYDENDLPEGLARLSLNYHLHLPLDIPWDEGEGAVREVVGGLLDKTAHLSPWSYVLHPPAEARRLEWIARLFAERGLSNESLLLENTPECDLLDMWCEVRYYRFGICLDLGHLLAFGQSRLLEVPLLWRRVKLVHLCATDADGRHLPLSRLDGRGRETMRHMLMAMEPRTVVMLEVFSEDALADSAATLADLTASWGLAAC